MKGAIAGIDLGTTYSAVAVLNPMGRPEVVPNLDGERIMPSALFFPEGEEGRSIVTGIEAINSRHEDAARCVRWIKSHMGEAQHRVAIGEMEFSPSQISAAILKKLRDDASNVLGEEIEEVIITVPANFGEVARKATMEAGEMAGLKVLGLVNEPTAAAFYYAVTHEIGGRTMIFDLGGGTFDVSVAEIEGREVRILCSQGDRHLGGRDFDLALLDFFAACYQEEFGEEAFEDDESKAEIEDYCESIKKTLSKRNEAKVRINGPAGVLRLDITREKFEELIGSYIATMEMLVEGVLQESGCAVSEIQNVLLVGGSCRIPAVSDLIRKIFGYEPLQVGNLDECVALGAALCAGFRKMSEDPGSLSEGVLSGLSGLKLSDVCNHSYGTTAMIADALTGRNELKNVVLIQKNTPIPCETTRVFLTADEGQTEITTDVTQGEGEDVQMVEHLASETMELPEGRPAGMRVRVTYSYDVNQIMRCVFVDEESGTSKTITIDALRGEKDITSGLVENQNALAALIES